jgi:hypothetical protein
MGYSRVGSSLLCRASRPWSFPGYSDAGSTCSPSLGMLATAVGDLLRSLNRGGWRLVRHSLRFIVRAMPQHRPGDSRHFVSERGHRDVGMGTFRQGQRPATEPVSLAGGRP